jgi:hypothetical protein
MLCCRINKNNGEARNTAQEYESLDAVRRCRDGVIHSYAAGKIEDTGAMTIYTRCTWTAITSPIISVVNPLPHRSIHFNTRSVM